MPARAASRRLAAVVLLAVALFAAAMAHDASAATQVVHTSLISDGTAPTKDAGAAGVQDPGDDLDLHDNVVRTLDEVTFRVDWSLNDPNGTHPQLILSLPAGFRFLSTPPAASCNNTAATVVTTNDIQTLTCDQGVFNPGDDSITQQVNLRVGVPASAPNGSTFGLTAKLDDGTDVVTDPPSPATTVKVSSAPNVDLFKSGCFLQDCNPSTLKKINVPGYGEGFVFDYAVGLRGTGGTDSRGISQIPEPVMFGDDVRIPNGDGSDGTSWYSGPNAPGLTLMGCSSGGGFGERWPGPTNPVASHHLDAIQITCSQAGDAKGGAVKIGLSGFNWGRTDPPPTCAVSNGGCFGLTTSGMIGYAHLRYFLSYADWLKIAQDRGDVTPTTVPDGSIRQVGHVAIGDRLVGLDNNGIPKLAASSGACVPSTAPGSPIMNPPGASQQGWLIPADVDTSDPSSFDPVDIGGVSNQGAAIETAKNNGACESYEIGDIVPTSIGGVGQSKFPISPGNTRDGPFVAPDARIQTGLQIAPGQVTLRAAADATDPAFGLQAGAVQCDKWDNRRFGPNPDDGGNWLTPRPVAGAGGPAGGPQDYNAEYGPGGYTVEYGIGNWGSHNPDDSNGFYWQGRSQCEDTATAPSGSGGGYDPGSALLEVTPGTYWVSAGQVDFTNSHAAGTVVNIDDVNAVRVTLTHAVPPMLPSELDARANDQDATNDLSRLADTNPVTRSVQAQFTLDWRDRPNQPVPTQFRNYANTFLGRGGVAPGWANAAAAGFNDTTKTANVQPPGQGNNVGTDSLSLWWQLIGPDAAVLKTRVSPAGTVDPGDDVTWRLRARGVPPAGTPATATGVTPTITVYDVIPHTLTYVPGSTVTSGGLNIGEPTILPNTNRQLGPDGSYDTLRWTVPALDWAPDFNGTVPFDITIRTTADEDIVPAARRITNFLSVTGPTINFPGGSSGGGPFDATPFERITSAFVDTPDPPPGGSAAILNKTVTPSNLKRNTPFTYSLVYANFSETPIETFDAIDLLPWPQDHDPGDPNPDHSRRSTFDPGAIKLLSITPSSKGEVAWVSKTPPAVLDAADSAGPHANADHDAYLDSDYADPLGSPQWPCLATDVGTAACPQIATFDQVTAVRFVGAGTPGSPFFPPSVGPFTIKLNFTTTALAKPGDLYDNSWVAHFGDLLPVYRPIRVPPTVPPPAMGVEKLSGPSATGPWNEVTRVGHDDPAFFQITVTNNGVNPLSGFVITDNDLADCETPTPAPPASLASGDSFTFTCTDPHPGAAPHPTGYVNTVTVAAHDDDGNPVTPPPHDPAEVIVLPPGVSVGNFVWRDLDHDGRQDAGEPGISGVTVTLTGPGGGAVTDVGGQSVGPVVTDGTGKYLFPNLPLLGPGEHYTTHIDNGQPALSGLAPTLDTVGADRAVDSSTSDSVSIAALDTGGAADLSLDFGFVTPQVSVGNFVWIDSNGNGIQDGGEPGIPNVRVVLTAQNGGAVTDVNGAGVQPVLTDATGHYQFTGLPVLAGPGNFYRVTIDNSQAPLAGSGLTPTKAAQGGDEAVDSSTGVATSAGTDLTGDGATDQTLDFGFISVVNVGDYVWSDLDADGIQDPATSEDPGEPGIPGVVVTLTGPGGGAVTDFFGDPVGPATTNASGLYAFPNLPALPAGQHYTVHIDNGQSALTDLGLVPTKPGVGGGATDSSTGSAESTDLPNGGDKDLSLDFGFVAKVSVGDFVWIDKNRDGIQNGGEPGIHNVTLTLTGPGGANVTDVFGTPVGPASTDANGHYQFDNLPPLLGGDRYTVHVDNGQAALTGLVPTVAGAGADPAADSATSMATSTALSDPGATDQTLDFGFVETVRVGDYVWIDADRDGLQDAGEAPIPGVTLTLTGPGGGAVTDVTGATVGPVQTDANGKYLFDKLPPLAAGDHYTVHVDNTQAALAGAGLTPTTAGAGADRGKDSSTGSATSGDLPNGGDEDLSLDFGFSASVTVGDVVFNDLDNDGTQDAGEPGIKNVTVTLTGPGGGAVTSVDGTLVGPATTDSDGKYLFPGLPILPAGQHYTTHVSPAQAPLAGAGLVPTRAGAGGNPAKDSSTGSAESTDLTDGGDEDLTLDFGFTAVVSVGDFVWSDLDGDGIQENGEPGLPGVTVTITGPGGTPVSFADGSPATPVQTDPDGKYTFPNLPALPAGQHYTVHVDPDQAVLTSVGLVPTTPGAGADPSQDSSTGTAESGDLPNPGDADTTLDFGFVPPARLCGVVYADVDIDLLYGGIAKDTPLAGATVTLTGTDHDGHAVTLTTTTDAAGKYCFEPQRGTYTVTVTPPAGYGPEVSNPGTKGGTPSTPTTLKTITLEPRDESLENNFGLVQADLEIVKTVSPATAQPGQSVTFTLTVTNHGPTGATNVSVTDPLPAGVAFASASAGCANAANTVTCSMPKLLKDNAVTFTITATVTATTAGTLENEATVRSEAPDPKPENNRSKVPVTITVPPAPAGPPGTPPGKPKPPVPAKPKPKPATKLVVKEKVTRKLLKAGGHTLLKITVTNPGGTTLKHVKVCDRLPAGLAYVTSSAHGRLTGGRVCFAIASLGAHRSRTVTIEVRALALPVARSLVDAVTATAGALKTVARTHGAIRVLPANASGAGVTG